MLFLYLHFEPYWLKIAWRPVSVALVVVQVWGTLTDSGNWRHTPAADAANDAVTYADLTTLLFLAPSLLLNLFYAFF